jgi:hypothetical protein
MPARKAGEELYCHLAAFLLSKSSTDELRLRGPRRIEHSTNTTALSLKRLDGQRIRQVKSRSNIALRILAHEAARHPNRQTPTSRRALPGNVHGHQRPLSTSDAFTLHHQSACNSKSGDKSRIRGRGALYPSRTLATLQRSTKIPTEPQKSR